jgi:hypothetical protein
VAEKKSVFASIHAGFCIVPSRYHATMRELCQAKKCRFRGFSVIIPETFAKLQEKTQIHHGGMEYKEIGRGVRDATRQSKNKKKCLRDCSGLRLTSSATSIEIELPFPALSRS